ncbi:MAG TPA: lipid-A-disaccharide synthase, partial [Elusimicrobiota bacterium]|nr:lipid-A-disaccharide synthase [Elusimicrobiota bacterium]
LPAPDPEPPAHAAPLLGLLPGSRRGEIRRHLGLFLQTADRLTQDLPNLRCALFAAPSIPDDFYNPLLARHPHRTFPLEIVREEHYAQRAQLDLALTCSGTATLENALLGIPMLVVYKMSWITYGLARALIRVEHIAMANILAGKKLVPELIQDQASPALLAQEALRLLKDPQERLRVRRELLSLRQQLGGPGAADRAAAEIIQALG